jgi:ElaB/YqjD/DUF883 family membrane-anchored ribosome-binding protein
MMRSITPRLLEDVTMTVRDEVAQKDIDALRAELGQLRKDLSAMAGTLKGIAGDVGADAYQRVRTTAEQARQRAERAAEDVSSTIEERPLMSVVIAFVVGLLLGAVFGRRH